MRLTTSFITEYHRDILLLCSSPLNNSRLFSYLHIFTYLRMVHVFLTYSIQVKSCNVGDAWESSTSESPMANHKVFYPAMTTRVKMQILHCRNSVVIGVYQSHRRDAHLLETSNIIDLPTIFTRRSHGVRKCYAKSARGPEMEQ